MKLQDPITAIGPVQLNLTKCMDLTPDYILLGDQLKTVDEHFQVASPQHEARRWEYSMCLRAYQAWKATRPDVGKVVVADIGGAGSPLPRMLMAKGLGARVVDPKSKGNERPSTVEAYENSTPRPQHDVVTCISVVEHVKDEHLENFLDALAGITAPGGLLFLTMDCWGRDPDEKDTAMFHWMRARIYTVKTWQGLAREMVDRGFKLFGAPDWSYHGNHVENAYSFASLCLQKGAAK